MNKQKKPTHPVFKPAYNIEKRVKQDEKQRNFLDYTQR